MNPNSPVRATGKPRSGSVKARKLAMLMAAMAASSQLVPTPVAAQAATTTGTVQGRVLNAATGMYLNNARVTVVGTGIETFTNEFGEYTIPNVPTGQITLRATFTGQEPQTATISVESGKASSQNFSFSKDKASVEEDGTIVLNEFVVASDRFRNAEQIAANEERYSTNIKNVVSTDAFGYIAGGNIGEFVKYLPGVETQYGGADAFANGGIGGVNQATASQISVRGFGAADTAVTIDGMPLSGIAPGALTRAVGLDMISINNASRVEVIKVATPDMPNESAGGTVNLVTKSAFEFAKPEISVTVGATFNTEETDIFKKSPGPANKSTYHTLPTASVSVSVPVSKSFGFTISAATANNFSPNDYAQAGWHSTTTTNFSRIPTGSTTTRVQNSSGETSSLVNPFLRDVQLYDNPWNDFKNSGSLKLDWRPTPSITLSGNYTVSQYTGINVNRRLQLRIAQPKDWGSDFTIGQPFEAATTTPPLAQLSPSYSTTMEVTARDKKGLTQSGYVKGTYKKGPWTADASASTSVAHGEFVDLENDHFSSVELALSNVGQIIFNGVKEGVPTEILVFDRNKNKIDYSRLSSWTINNASSLQVGSQRSEQDDTDDNYMASLRRDLDFLPFSASLKIGGSYRKKTTEKSGFGTGYKLAYTGTVTRDQIIDEHYEKTPGTTFGYSNGSGPQQWADVYKMYELYKLYPERFDANATQALQGSNYRSILFQSKSISEENIALYAMIDGNLFNNRLAYVVGARKTESKREGTQPYSDGNWNYLKNPDGTRYKDTVYTQGVTFNGSNMPVTGSPVTTATQTTTFLNDTALLARLQAAKVIYPSQLLLTSTGAATSNSNTLESARLAAYSRSVDSSTKNPVTPSVSLAYKITDSLTFKPSWSRETQLPVLDAGNNGTGGIIGTYSISENAAGVKTYTISNPDLKPQTVNSFNFQLAYYTKNGGSLSATYYYKRITNQWETETIGENDPSFGEVGAPYGIAADGNGIEDFISTTTNGDAKATRTGYELSVRQNLGFLGRWGSYFTGFANYSHKNEKSSSRDGVVSLSISPKDTWSAGLNMNVKRFGAGVRMVYRGDTYEKNGRITHQGQSYQLYRKTPEEYKMDAQMDYQISKRFSFFTSANNVLNTERQTRQVVAGDILPEYATYTLKYKFGVQITAGINAKF